MAVRAVNGVLGALGLEKHPDKTFIGQIERGFDFLGYHFGPEGLTMAARTIEQFVERAIRLYEQEPGAASTDSRFGMYVRRWAGWAETGFKRGKLLSVSRFRKPHQFGSNNFSWHGAGTSPEV